MSVQFKLNLFNGWDYLPLSNVSASGVENAAYELIIKLSIPSFVPSLLLNYLGLSVPQTTPELSNNDTEINSSTSRVPLENPFVTECREWIESGQFSLCEEGVGGTYFIKNSSGTTVGVFKPQDEEPGAPDNPKDLIQEPLLPPGAGYLREIAAYLLDRNFAGVPETLLLSQVRHGNFSTHRDKNGSLQRFIKNDGVSSDMGSSSFPVDAVHRIGILDLRIFNMDRNGENILVRRKTSNNNSTTSPDAATTTAATTTTLELIPIDHTYSLPPITCLDSAFFEWHFWPQSKKPFSQSTLDYILSIDIESDAQILHSLGIPEPCILTMIVSTLLLKEAAAAGWTLFDLANFVSRNLATQTMPSRLEEVIAASIVEKGGSDGIGSFLGSFQAKLQTIFSK